MIEKTKETLNYQEAIEQLEFDKNMIVFDPATGETSSLEAIRVRNPNNYLTYLADEIAIDAIRSIQKYKELGTYEELKRAVEFYKEAQKNK